MNDFSIVIQIRWKIHSVLIQVIEKYHYEMLYMAWQLYCRGMCNYNVMIPSNGVTQILIFHRI